MISILIGLVLIASYFAICLCFGYAFNELQRRRYLHELRDWARRAYALHFTYGLLITISGALILLVSYALGHLVLG